MNYTNFDCKTFQEALPDLVLTPGALPSAAMQMHLETCSPCAEEYLSFQSTFAVLDTWTVPEPSPFFEQKMAVLLREEQTKAPMGWLERLQTGFSLNSGRAYRPLLAGALALALAVGGGSLITADYSATSVQHAPVAAAVVDLQILDRNEQAFQQMDLLQEDEGGDSQPAPAPAAVPES